MARSKQVKSIVTNPKLVEKRRGQILQAAIKLFSRKGFYRTTILDIAKEAGTSSGLIYQYFREKDDVLFLGLLNVLETYEREIPPRLEGIEHPVDRLCEVLRAYCAIVDQMREATVLAYRSTKSLPAERRVHIKEAEEKSNHIIRQCLKDCADGGYLKTVNLDLLIYQYVMFCHAWALKHWAFRDDYDIDTYVDEGLALLVDPHLTAKGVRARTALNAAQ